MNKFQYNYKGILIRRTNTKAKGAKATQYFIVLDQNPIYFNTFQEAVVYIDRMLLNKIMLQQGKNNGRGGN